MYWRPGATARAVEDAGLRATIGAPADRPRRRGRGRQPARRGGAQRWRRSARLGELVRPALAPHAIYTVSEPSLRWIAERLAGARAARPDPSLGDRGRGRPMRLDEHGARPAEYLERLGLLGPATLLAHGVWLDDAELELIAARGATVVTNPVANLKLAVGRVFPYLDARRHGVRVGLGTDGAGSNNSLDLLSGREDVRAPAEARGRAIRPRSRPTRHGRSPPGGGSSLLAGGASVSVGDAGRLPAAAVRRAGARARRLHGRASCTRRRDRSSTPRWSTARVLDARRPGSRARTRSSPTRWSGRGDWDWPRSPLVPGGPGRRRPPCR